MSAPRSIIELGTAAGVGFSSHTLATTKRIEGSGGAVARGSLGAITAVAQTAKTATPPINE